MSEAVKKLTMEAWFAASFLMKHGHVSRGETLLAAVEAVEVELRQKKEAAP
jgi:hypothetical protein